MKKILGPALWSFFKYAVYGGFGKPRKPITADSSPYDIEMARRHKLGSVDGKYFLYWIDTIKLQKRLGQYDEAIELLLKIVDAVEREAKYMEWGVAPWYYEQLAIIYRKQKRRADEVAILERYAAADKAAGRGPDRMADRLTKAKILAAKAVQFEEKWNEQR